jgi:hypothetical protein
VILDEYHFGAWRENAELPDSQHELHPCRDVRELGLAAAADLSVMRRFRGGGRGTGGDSTSTLERSGERLHRFSARLPRRVVSARPANQAGARTVSKPWTAAMKRVLFSALLLGVLYPASARGWRSARPPRDGQAEISTF